MSTATKLDLAFQLKEMQIYDRAMMSNYEKNRNRAFRRTGSIWRRHARRLIKKNPPFKMKREQKRDERGRFMSGTAPTKLVSIDRKTSEPGQPPFDHTVGENVVTIRNILYGIDGDVLIAGPLGFKRLGRPTTERLEMGDGDMEPRPFMFPTLKAKYDEFQASIKKFGLV